jgi:predicted AAA+ superfamily ATPase
MDKYIDRRIDRELRKLLGFFPAVGLIGPRQVGKTTLVQQLKGDFVYLDLEDDRDRVKLASDPHFFFKSFEDKCIVLDEVQQMPEIFKLLRGVIDANRRPGRFLLLGSASPELLRQSSESLAGRIAYLELAPLDITELDGWSDWRQHWLMGGFPDALLAPDEDMSLAWRRHFIRTFVERDLPALGLGADPLILRRFAQMLAGENGGIWQAEKFARALGLSSPTVKRYISFFENAFLTTTLQPWCANVSKRLVKSPKVYILDSGLLHALLDIGRMEELLGHTGLGASWEGYVLRQLKSLIGDRMSFYFYRTHQGAECDIVLVKGNKPVAGIEVKFSSVPTLGRGVHSAVEDLQTTQNFVIIPADEDYPLQKGWQVCGLRQFIDHHLPKLI